MLPFRVIAIISAFNEEDIIGSCLEHLHRQGVETYLIDDGSTDATVLRAQAYLGRGLLRIEELQPIRPPTFSLERILARKETLSRELDAHWFINHDVDEFRDSAWAEQNLAGAMTLVDELGWNAIDFEIFNIRPHGSPDATVDPSDSAVRYEPAAAHDRPQVRAWKNLGIPIDLRASGGHDVAFNGRRVFPIPFPMRHYPVRSAEHGRKKILQERVPRFDASERERGWHVQYDGVSLDNLVVPSAALQPYDPVGARIACALANRDLEAAERRNQQLTALREAAEHDVACAREAAAVATLERDHLADELRQAEQATADLIRERDHAMRERDAAAIQAKREIDRITATAISKADRTNSELQRLSADIATLQEQLRAVYASRSWRWTRALRALAKPLFTR